MKWHGHGVYHSDCDRVIIERASGQQWRVRFHPDIAPNGITEDMAVSLCQAKAMGQAAIRRVSTPPDADIQGLHSEIYKRLADGERYRAALEAIRLRCEASETVDSAGLRWLVDNALEAGDRMR